ncbi:hypothetical protein BZL54_04070 [Burkholderia ubonensis subsp. mesacidophila]|uniref:Class I SAM-dependent methyltransferase n=1 Tax=Burkholderia ubonensis subsp. mesacidophila TaxID=265293 RepID=A0A2A4FM16_9BURK|nr:hypothetical protein BZL54_04070 [Burkholderia ubonensis subsp. mesacidophila]
MADNDAFNSTEITEEGDSYSHILVEMEARFPHASRYVDFDRMRDMDLVAILSDLRKIESGGFSHESVGGHYGRQQLSVGKALSRRHGYLALARLLQRSRRWQQDHVLFDALAGNGTFDRVMQSLVEDRPSYVGNDVSITMVRQAHDDGRLVFYSDLRTPLLRDAFADYGVSAYGTHHVPPDARAAFVAAAGRRLKAGGTFVLQDFIENSPTADWYAECIHEFRGCGHAYRHFERGELAGLLHGAGFVDVSEHLVYDPFVMPLEATCGDFDARGMFFDYLIDLFALDRLRRIVGQEGLSTRMLDNLLSPYFRLADADLAELRRDTRVNDVADVWLVPELTIRTIDGMRYLIAPRVAIAAVGTRAAHA